MLAHLRRSQNWTALWAAVALFVVTLRAFIPQGLMLDESVDGKLSIVICSAQGVQQVQVGHDGGDDGSRHHNGDHGCAFAVAAHAVFPSLLLPAIAPDIAVPGVFRLPGEQILAAFTAPPLPARGPPHSA